MKRVLAEVTDHMEQQYSNQRYLDTLRTDNEAMALLERERHVMLMMYVDDDDIPHNLCYQIGQLKNELKLKKQEVKQDKLHIERLTTKSKHLKSQQKLQERYLVVHAN